MHSYAEMPSHFPVKNHLTLLKENSKLETFLDMLQGGFQVSSQQPHLVCIHIRFEPHLFLTVNIYI